jgi:hypothetical protein
VYAKTEQQSFVMRIDAHEPVKVNDQINVTIDLSRVHFFDDSKDNDALAANLTLPDAEPVEDQEAVGASA